MAELDYLATIPGIPFPQIYETMMDWKTPIIAAIAYEAGIQILARIFGSSATSLSRVEAKKRGDKTTQSRSNPLMTAFCLAHNMALCIYSAVTFYNMVKGLHKARTRDAPLFDRVCDLDEFFWRDTLAYWGYLFYLSKYYEMVDTIIIVLKGRQPSFLQLFHHAGALITMWAGIRYRCTAIWMFCTFNSFIHTIMYFYYAATTVGLHPPGKQYLTSMQIAQFVVGVSLALAYLLYPGCTNSPGERFTLKINIIYVTSLVGLFANFMRKTYGRSRNDSKKKNN
ncbi:hypothetical protein LRAMOSA07816 [Lichtheimia ramosa]|uniref:Elongation of fatty acids protein n=1 Tax=Lichtheimia ramosa TaxID=688394 RepID=A0A077WF60_9FUNG|nr:hypothetical protein LRAMOSA07816 [Lichtheimia ramosa]